MGTRSITILRDGSEDHEIAVLYRQYDGQPTGHGLDIFECLAGRRVTSGWRDATDINGAGDMCCQLIAYLKRSQPGAGGFYLYPPGTRDAGEEYTYTLTAEPGKPIHLTVSDGTVLYDGSLDDFDSDTCEQEED